MELPNTPLTELEKIRIKERIEQLKREKLAEFRTVLYADASGPREACLLLAQEQWEIDAYRSAIESDYFDGKDVKRGTSTLIPLVERVAGEFSVLNPNYTYMAKAYSSAMVAQNDAKAKMLAEALTAIEQLKQSLEHEKLVDDQTNPAQKQQPAPQAQNYEMPSATNPLSSEIRAFIKELESNGNLPKSIEEIATILKRFEQFCQDADIESITRQKIMEYRESLKLFPSHIPTKHKGKDFNTLVQLNIEPKIATPTINKHIEMLSRLFRWSASNNRKVPADITYKTALKDKRKESEQRDAYTNDDLKAVFSIPEYLGNKRFSKAYYWSPLISLYSGMRIEEISQLNARDIFLKEGSNIYCIDIHNTEEDMKLKTTSSKRVIPVHNKLLELGFIEYVETIKKKKHVKLFPTLTKDKNNGYSHSVGKWYSSMKIKLGMPESKVFHSFRHTLADTLKQAGIEERYVAAIVGHKTGEISFERYAKEFKPEILAPILNKVEFDIPALPYSKCLLIPAEARALSSPKATEALKNKRLADRHSTPNAMQADADDGSDQTHTLTQETAPKQANSRTVPQKRKTPAKPISKTRSKPPAPEKK